VTDEVPEIAFERVTKSFPRTDGAGGTFDAVRELSFAVRRGELVAILGRTGCGKSTTFNLISGLLRPTSGKVSVKGHDPFAQFRWFRGKIGIVFQNDRLMPWRTAFENVELGLELNKVEKAQRNRYRHLLADPARPEGSRQRLSACALGRHASARLDCACVRDPAGDPVV
jgi:NitT/TauT family transport system ATP-binding protein